MVGFRVVDGRNYNAKNAKNRKERKASHERWRVESVDPERGSLSNDSHAGVGDTYYNAYPHGRM